MGQYAILCRSTGEIRMKVVLAGYNVDAEILRDLKDRARWEADNVTPETLSAAYARISRDPRDIEQLRAESRTATDKARKSNETIIFGLGHASVAEHAVFNLDIIGVSRLAAEAVQQFRLAAYTEKSQRYITLDGDFVTPPGIIATGLGREFHAAVAFQNETYRTLYRALREHLFKKHAHRLAEKNGERTVDGWAKEDARYVVSLATATQFGMTVNARELEHLLRRLRADRRSEVRALAEALYREVAALSPSIIKYTRPTPYDSERPETIRRQVTIAQGLGFASDVPVRLVTHDPDPDGRLCAAILFAYGGGPYEAAVARVATMPPEERRELIRLSLAHRACWDKVDRAFETVSFTFELVVSATNYAQLKRHRMTTQIVQDYDLGLGVTMPPNIVEIGREKEFSAAVERSEELYRTLAERVPEEKDYILTNAHRRRVLLVLNARELYHFSALREDEHAQWDIRETARRMREEAEKVAPFTLMMLCGKSDFERRRDTIFEGENNS